MTFGVFLILAANFIVPGASQDLICLLADAAAGAVWAVGVEPASYGITGKCLLNNPILDVCYSAGTTYIAGPTSTLPGADPSMGGHIARIGSDCKPELIAEFPEACTAIGCDNDRLVFALEGVGIKSMQFDGSDKQDHGSIPGSFIRNIFVDIPTQTSYSVDINSQSIYAVDYTVNTMSIVISIGTTAEAFALSVVYECTNKDDSSFWSRFNTNELVANIRGPSSAQDAYRKVITMGKNSDGVDVLEFTFTLPSDVVDISLEYKLNKDIQLTLLDAVGNIAHQFPIIMNPNVSVWKAVTWVPPANIQFDQARISFGDFLPTMEVKIRNYNFEVCPSFAGATAGRPPRTAFLNILHNSCRVERCPIDGPYVNCSVVRQSSGSQSCLPISGPANRVVIHDDKNTIYEMFPLDDPPVVNSISTSADDVVGMDCFVRTYDPADEFCDPNPCLNYGDCIPTLAGYYCICPEPYVGNNCEILCPECDASAL